MTADFQILAYQLKKKLNEVQNEKDFLIRQKCMQKSVEITEKLNSLDCLLKSLRIHLNSLY
jgi:hypothetical protein